MTHDQTYNVLGYFADRKLPPLTTAALRFVVLLLKWETRRLSRKSLQHLDDHLLNDIGVSRGQAQQQLHRRFWQD